MWSRPSLRATALQLWALQTNERRNNRCCWFTKITRKLLMVCTLFVLSNYKGAKSLQLADLTILTMLRSLAARGSRSWKWADVPPTGPALDWFIVWCATASGHSGRFSPITLSVHCYCLWTIRTKSLSKVTGANAGGNTVGRPKKLIEKILGTKRHQGRIVSIGAKKLL